VKVVFVSAEVAPWSKSGGLADVAGSLPQALAALGVDVTVVTPLYQTTDRTHLVRRLSGLGVPLGGDRLHADIWEGRAGGTRVLFLDPPGFFERPFLYGPPGAEYADNSFRFAFLARGALEVALALDLAPDLFHANDWHTGLLPILLRRHLAWTRIGSAATVFTVHNLGYQGLFPAEVIDVLDLGADLHAPSGLEFYGRASYLKAGLLFADAITTVSPTYAKEIQTAEHGHGMDGVVRVRAASLSGILNGIDMSAWDPATDTHLPARYDAADLRGKRTCKRALCVDLGLDAARFAPALERGAPLFAIVSRLAWQKGWDLLEPVIDDLLADLRAGLVVVGTGEPRYEHFFREVALRYPSQVAVRIGFDEGLAHRIEAGADMLLMPSRYEPCGLNQMYSLRYGTIPVVHATGGLEDTVVDDDEAPSGGTGFKFRVHTPEAFAAACERALVAYGDEAAWVARMRRAMAGDFSWQRAAREYKALYERVVNRW
jgi:starch synthase